MKKFSIKELSRIEAEIDSEILFVEARQRGQMAKKQGSAQAARDTALAAIKAGLGKRNALVKAKFAIRSIKQVFNAEKGINDKTREIAALELERQFLDTIHQYDDVQAYEGYGQRPKTEYLPGISLKTQDEYRAKSRVIARQIQRLKDSCQGINNQGIIELDEATYSTLVTSGLIDA